MTALTSVWPWPSPAEQLENDRKLRRELESEVARFESRYAMTSAEMRARIDAGDLDEDAELCQWLMDMEILEALPCAGGE
ncbi:MAG TPA: hypothetical protein VJQ83_02370 [Tepidiformaceae bacterium]|nr:hypothetical protein [Tepidiformaceae bacterium]